MKKFGRFLYALYGKINENEILPLATQLTYRLVFSLFPFIIFLISLVGFFEIDPEFLLDEVSGLFPAQIAQVINDVIYDVVDTRNPSIMSTSLLFYIFTVASGFRAVMRGIHKAYDQEDTRNAVVRWLYCTLLVIALALAIVSSLLVIIFGDTIYSLIDRYFHFNGFFVVIFGFTGVLITITIMLAVIILIYRLSYSKKQTIISLLPGAMFTLAVWAISSSAFNFWVNNFSRHSLIYGSIASIFITMLWLNIISATILIGAQTNALLSVHSGDRGRSPLQ
ncbi:MAG: YihY/virulence factor BrkB family protein [Defluviitaleaceae bacterium]|nr:YihY/virulence factor BrkB family protein [Defluviitaleaceae bacterium]